MVIRMRELIEDSKRLRNILIKKGFLPELAELIAQNLNTEYTAQRMLGYLMSNPHPSEEELVDEMLAITSDRDRFVQKHLVESYNVGINDLYMRRDEIFSDEDE